MALPKLEINLISECFVKPNEVLESSKHPYHLSPIDIVFLFSDPIQKGLLFPFPNHPTRPDIRTLFDKLKLSLSIALVHFYPLAGRIQLFGHDDETMCSIQIDCTKGPGARLIHATMDLAVPDILSSTDVHPAVRSFFDLGERTLNLDGLTKALLTVQLTELLDGVFIGFTMNHTVGDGTSFIHFVSALSEIFNSEAGNSATISRVPRYNKHIPDGLGPVFKLAAPQDEIRNYVRPVEPVLLRDRIFHFSPESIATIKAKANEECGSEVIISSFMALSGLLWRAMTRAHKLGPDEETSFSIPMNTRTRLDPPLTDDYSGNFVANPRGVCKVNELLGQNLGWASSLLGQEVKKFKPEKILESIKGLAYFLTLGKEEREACQGPHEHNIVKMGGSHRFDMYGPEFGMGRAAAVLMGFGGKVNGKATANPGREGKGSVDLEVSLKPELMSSLESDEEFMSYVT